MQQHFFWICNVVPNKIWDSSCNIDDVNDDDYEFIFDEDVEELLELV